MRSKRAWLVAVAAAVAVGVTLALVSRGATQVSPIVASPSQKTPGIPMPQAFDMQVATEAARVSKHRVLQALCVGGYRFAQGHTAACFVVVFRGQSKACDHVWWADRQGSSTKVAVGPSLCANNAATRELGIVDTESPYSAAATEHCLRKSAVTNLRAGLRISVTAPTSQIPNDLQQWSGLRWQLAQGSRIVTGVFVLMREHGSRDPNLLYLFFFRSHAAAVPLWRSLTYVMTHPPSTSPVSSSVQLRRNAILLWASPATERYLRIATGCLATS